MEGKGRFGTRYDENSIRSDCRLRIQGMSDLFAHECVDIAWDDFFLDDDRIVPHHGSERPADHSTLGENKKRCRRELARKEKSEVLPLSNTKNTMLEKDSWSRPFTSESGEELIKEAASLTCDTTTSLPHGLKSNNRDLNSSEVLKNGTSLVDDSSFSYPIGDVNHTSNDHSFFEHAHNNDSSDLLYCGWSDIENFDDIDQIFRSDSTSGLGVGKEDELSWLSSAVYTGGPGDAPKSDAEFLCPDPEVSISENHDILNGSSPNDFAMNNAPISKDCSWTSEKSDSYTSFLTGPDIDDTKDGFIHPKQGIGSNAKIQPRISNSSHSRSGYPAVTSELKRQIKLQSQSEGKSKLHGLENGGLTQISDLQNEIMKPRSGLTCDKAFSSVHVQQQQHTQTSDSDSCLENPISSIHIKDTHPSNPSSVNLERPIMKSETNDLASISSGDSHHALGQLQYLEGFPGPPFKETALVVCGQREKQENCQGSLSSISEPHLVVGNYENHRDLQGVSSATTTEMGSSNMQESSTMAPDLDDISLEAASFRQLQLVTKQLDLRTKLCIRDSLYRLAESAEQRCRNLNQNGSLGDESDAAGEASEAEGTNRCTDFMDMETDTNPIDRSVAHLLFHRPSDPSTTPARDSFSFKPPSVVVSPPMLSDRIVSQEKVSEV